MPSIREASCLLLAACTLGACAAAEMSNVTTRARHWIVIVDLSASLKPSQLQESRNFVQALSSAARNGDAVTLFRVYERGLADENFQWDSNIRAAADPLKPRASDSLALKDFSDELMAVSTVLFDPKIEGSLRGTDIFASLFRAADVAASDPRRRNIVILVSDMVQSTKELDMERHIPDASWVSNAAEKQMLPRLHGVCVSAFGVDVMTPRGRQAREFWKRYLTAAGADFREANYRNYAVSPDQLVCDES
jgi:hypothetical protein